MLRRLLVVWSLALALTGGAFGAEAGAASRAPRPARQVRVKARVKPTRPVAKKALRRVQSRKPALKDLLGRLLKGKRLVLASKTGMYTFNEDGSATRGSGGVVTALASIDAPMVWVAAPNGAADRR
ncbi:MAG TPA: hypothetical protein VFU21_08425, partial [Kofleriaceae bacterium]|nr:hypothetical protein [Kofleriaceae bacterium]